MNAAPIMIMAGGTGGHVFPALAVAQALQQRDENVVWQGTASGLEAQIVPAAGIPLDRILDSGLRGKGILNWLRAPYRVMRSLVDALRVMNRRKPGVVLSAIRILCRVVVPLATQRLGQRFQLLGPLVAGSTVLVVQRKG